MIGQFSYVKAVHSLADTLNQVLLYIGVKRSAQGPDKEHPYGPFSSLKFHSNRFLGHGLERNIYALVIYLPFNNSPTTRYLLWESFSWEVDFLCTFQVDKNLTIDITELPLF